jgi:hypothetical protein
MPQPGSGITVEPREIDPSQSDLWIDATFFDLDRGMPPDESIIQHPRRLTPRSASGNWDHPMHSERQTK